MSKDYKIQHVELDGVWSSKLKTVNGEGQEFDHSSVGFSLSWGAEGFGFGELAFTQYADGRVEADTETMSREFVAAVFQKFVEQMKIKGE